MPRQDAAVSSGTPPLDSLTAAGQAEPGPTAAPGGPSAHDGPVAHGGAATRPTPGTPTAVCVGESMAVLLPDRPGPLEAVENFRLSVGGA
ncbi:hypothetical protein ACFVXQ_26245, partial [Kitasatospora sp. NPDC058263]